MHEGRPADLDHGLGSALQQPGDLLGDLCYAARVGGRESGLEIDEVGEGECDVVDVVLADGCESRDGLKRDNASWRLEWEGTADPEPPRDFCCLGCLGKWIAERLARGEDNE